MLILSIDTSTRGCSVALHFDGVLQACHDLGKDRSAAEFLTTLIEQICEHTGNPLSSVDAIAVAKGPGSYTGLRVGVSTAKGLCYALDKPLIGINTLKALAAQVTGFYAQPEGAGKKLLFCPMIDARRMEVFCAVYDINLNEVWPSAAVIVDEHTFAELLEEHTILFFGDGSEKCRPFLGIHEDALFLSRPVTPSATTIGELAFHAADAGAFEDAALFEPFYLKDFVGTKARNTSGIITGQSNS
jgi:tRNA threonylcarbamoyladenosine biosynthesis protein TsaB